MEREKLELIRAQDTVSEKTDHVEEREEVEASVAVAGQHGVAAIGVVLYPRVARRGGAPVILDDDSGGRRGRGGTVEE